MITFKKISYRNFLSTGNAENVIELDKHSSTLITGKNGEGKSTILCALTFALFGKPFRNVNKNQLINSINGKHCEVVVEFEVSGAHYRVIRGIKPNKFEIYCNDELINQDAALKDYQKVLEQQILKLNYKTFTQVVILGSATFVPFMQLAAAQRREVIEDILDIKIFSVMNGILKEKVSETKEEITRIEAEIASQKVKIDGQKKLIETLVASKNDAIASLQTKIQTNEESIQSHQSEVDALEVTLGEYQTKVASYDLVTEAIDKAKQALTKKTHTKEQYNTNMEFFESHETCPSCLQGIPHDHKVSIISDLDSKIKVCNNKLEELNGALIKLQDKMAQMVEVMDKIRDVNIEISTHNSSITLLNKQINSLQQEVNTITNNTGNIDDEKDRMKAEAAKAVELINIKNSLLEDRQLQEIASLMLKDSGIKTAIIREYLPVMNKLINKYLAAMDFYVKFELDESFSEVIKSRNRDEFTYDSFSEGEKRRLDLAILFTWRQIAKMKNSVNTNLMVLDEILDGALDAQGIEYFLSIMNEFGQNTNVFVISHRDVADKFDHVIRVVKKNEFSVVA